MVMKKCLLWLLSLAMLTGVISSGFMVSAAGAVVYSEDFQDNTTDIVVWGEDPAVVGTMTIASEGSNKLLKCVTSTGDGENGYTHTAFGPALKEFDFEFRMRPDNIKNPDFNWIKVLFRASPEAGENESYIFEVWDWRAAMSIKSTANKKSENKKLTENQDFIFENGKWYTIKVEGRGNQFTVYVNGKKCTTMTDSSNLFKEGIFGFASWGANFSVDDIKITSFDATDQTTATKNGSTTKPGTFSTATKGGSVANSTDSTKPDETTVASDSTATSGNGDQSNDTTTSETGVSGGAETTGVDNTPSDNGSHGGLIALLIVLAILLIGGGVAVVFILKKKNKVEV